MLQCVKGLIVRAQRRQRFNQVVAELSRYSERELYELGIPPADVKRVARQMARASF